jgi:hypothetical protein
MRTGRLAGAARLAALAVTAISASGATLGLAVPAAGASISVAGSPACPTPSVTSVTTATGQHAAAPGTTVDIEGSNLSSGICSTSIALGRTAVSATAASPSQLQFSMPAGAPGGAVVVSMSDLLGNHATSNSNVDFVALPAVSSWSDTSPVEGSALTASGSGFAMAGLPGAAADVSFCGAPPVAAVIRSDTSLEVTGPTAYCSGPATISFSTPTLSVGVAAGAFSVDPVVDSVSPAGAVTPGSTVTVDGSGFGPAGSATVAGLSAQISSWADRQVSLVVPNGATSGTLRLVRADGVTVTSSPLSVAGAPAPAVGATATANPTPATSTPATSTPAASTFGPSGTPSATSPASGAGAVAVLTPMPTSVAGAAVTPARAGPGAGPVGGRSATAAAVAAPALAATGGNGNAGIIRAPGTASAVAIATGATGSQARAPTTFSGTVQALPSTVGKAVALLAPRPLPLPWLLPAMILLAAVAAAYVWTLRRGGMAPVAFGAEPAEGVEQVWRVAGWAAAIVLGASYLLTAVSVLMTILTRWLPGAGTATLPGAGLYKVIAVMLSLVLTGIAVRYVYYYWCWVRSRHHFAHPSPVDVAMLAARDLPFMKFQVTTRGGALPIVERTVQGVVDVAVAHPWLAGRMSVEVVTESAEEAVHLPRRFAGAPVAVHALCLPASYQTPNSTALKARALHYMVERRIEGWNAVEGRSFIVHLDEETLVTAEHLLVLVDYLSGDPRPVSQGPILYPLEWSETPWLCRAMESLRPFGCSECARVMSNPPPPHLHGSNLVVDEAVENRIGWDFGTLDGQPYIAEDLLFGLRAYALLGETGFGWHGATMFEQPPLSVYWAVQQRLRWVLGALQGWRAMGQRQDLQAIPAKDRNRLRRAVAFRIATYALGFPVGFAGLFFLLHPAVRQSALVSPLGVWRLFIMLAGLGWIMSYQIGLARNLRYQDLRWFDRVRQHVTLLVLTPVTGLFETAGPFLALTRWLIGARQARWTPTPKTAERPDVAVRPEPSAGLRPIGLPAAGR